MDLPPIDNPPDIFKDGQIDCKDYAFYAGKMLYRQGYNPKLIAVSVWKQKLDHVVIAFEKDGSIWIADKGKYYKTQRRINND